MTEIKRNAIIMAAGTSSRFVPLSHETPKGLLEVKGEVLIERQIRQLQEAGITDITVVVGYKAEMFNYLIPKYGVKIVLNEDFNRYNNTSSIIRVLDKLGDTYICSSDNYFPENVFTGDPTVSYYSALYANGLTSEYCLNTDNDDNIVSVNVGGHDAWYMIGHVYFSKEFSEKFRSLLSSEYEKEETRQGYWEDVYIKHIDELPQMKIHQYSDGQIEEFDSIDELRKFDSSYIEDTRSSVIKNIAERMECPESELSGFKNIKHNGPELMFSFMKGNQSYQYDGLKNSIIKL